MVQVCYESVVVLGQEHGILVDHIAVFLVTLLKGRLHDLRLHVLLLILWSRAAKESN